MPRTYRKNPLRLNGLDIDCRTRIGRRVKAAANVYAEQLGGWSKLNKKQVLDVTDAAKSRVFLEITRAKYFEGLEGADPVSHEDVIRSQNSFDRALRRLGIQSDDAASSDIPFRERLMQAEDA